MVEGCRIFGYAPSLLRVVFVGRIPAGMAIGVSHYLEIIEEADRDTPSYRDPVRSDSCPLLLVRHGCRDRLRLSVHGRWQKEMSVLLLAGYPGWASCGSAESLQLEPLIWPSGADRVSVLLRPSLL